LLVKIDVGRFAPISFEDLDDAWGQRVCYMLSADEGCMSPAIVLKDKVLFSRSDGTIEWEYKSEETLRDVAWDEFGNVVVTSTGAVLSTYDGSLVEQLDPMTNCLAIARRPGGGYVGLSREGVVRVWPNSQNR
jgi:photosystem II stability/assembly factor-like uncharacterized protein